VRETIDFAARVQGVGVRPAELEALLAKGGQPAEPTEAEIHAFLEVNLLPGCLRHYTLFSCASLRGYGSRDSRLSGGVERTETCTRHSSGC